MLSFNDCEYVNYFFSKSIFKELIKFFLCIMNERKLMETSIPVLVYKKCMMQNMHSLL